MITIIELGKIERLLYQQLDTVIPTVSIKQAEIFSQMIF